MALDPRDHPGNEPARQAHLNDRDQRAVLFKCRDGPAAIVWLWHRALHRFVTGAENATLAGRPIASSHRAAREILGEHQRGKRTKIRSSKYLNNLIEQDHRSTKFRLGPMLGMKRFRSASITIAGIELMHRIRKGQFTLGRLRIKDNRAPAVWNAVLVA